MINFGKGQILQAKQMFEYTNSSEGCDRNDLLYKNYFSQVTLLLEMSQFFSFGLFEFCDLSA